MTNQKAIKEHKAFKENIEEGTAKYILVFDDLDILEAIDFAISTLKLIQEMDTAFNV